MGVELRFYIYTISTAVQCLPNLYPNLPNPKTTPNHSDMVATFPGTKYMNSVIFRLDIVANRI